MVAKAGGATESVDRVGGALWEAVVEGQVATPEETHSLAHEVAVGEEAEGPPGGRSEAAEEVDTEEGEGVVMEVAGMVVEAKGAVALGRGRGAGGMGLEVVVAAAKVGHMAVGGTAEWLAVSPAETAAAEKGVGHHDSSWSSCMRAAREGCR